MHFFLNCEFELVSDPHQGIRQRVLEASKVLYSNTAANGTTMDDVAKAAGIGRATLYRYFKNRDDLLLAVLEAEALAITARVDKKIRDIENPAEHIIEGMVQAVDEIRKSELLSQIFQSDSSLLINRLLFDSDRLLNIGLGIMVPVVERARQTGKLKTDMDFELLVEWILRILTSLVTIPSRHTGNKAAIRDMLRTTLLPVLEA